MICLWTGVLADWIDWELFPAFLVRTAPVVLIILTAIVTLLSAFIPRPYCRFVCPTGTLFKMSEGMKPNRAFR